MISLPVILSIMFLTVIYHFTRFVTSYLSGIPHDHYLIGFKPRLFGFKFANVKFSVGVFIPLPWIGQPSRFINGTNVPFNYTWELLDKPVSKRLITTISGIVSMALTGIIVMIATTYLKPLTYISKEEINKYGILPSELATAYGFQRNDKVLKINDAEYEGYHDLNNPEFFLTVGTTYTVLRNGKEEKIQVTAPKPYYGQQLFLSIAAPFEVYDVSPNSGAARAGILKGDRITNINGIPIVTHFDMREVLGKDDDGEVSVELRRLYDQKYERIEKTVQLDDQKRIGIFPMEIVERTERRYSLGESIVIGTQRAFNVVLVQLKVITRLMKGSIAPSRSVSGPIGIQQAFGDFWIPFWNSTVFYAMFFGVFWNLLPLPGSAFWEFFPLTYEGVTKKRIDYNKFRKVMKITRLTFLWMVGVLFVWIFVNDIIKLF